LPASATIINFVGAVAIAVAGIGVLQVFGPQQVLVKMSMCCALQSAYKERFNVAACPHTECSKHKQGVHAT